MRRNLKAGELPEETVVALRSSEVSVYRMAFLGYWDGKERWRGTGFNQVPGGITNLKQGSMERYYFGYNPTLMSPSLVTEFPSPETTRRQ